MMTAMRQWVSFLPERVKHVQFRLIWQYGVVFILVIITTLMLFTFKSVIGETKVSLIYLLLVLCCAAVAQPGVTFFCGLWSFLCYDFFLVPPVFDLRFASPIQVLDPLAFLVVAIVTSAIAERARQHANEKATYQKADQLRTTLLNLVSHNLRTPLSTVKTVLTTLLTQTGLDAESKQLLLDADQEIDHLNRLVANVLQISRLEARAVQINKHWDALDELITTVLARWPQELADGSLSADLTGIPSMIQFDFALIEAVLTNLIDNAFRHGSPPVKVTVTEHGDETWVSVEDSGPGVPVPDRPRLFERFVDAKSRGIGLGLAVCKGLIEAHGGRIWAEFPATSTRFTRFTFSLPLAAYSESMD